MRAAIVYNPKAGRLDTEGIVDWAAQTLQAKGWTVSVEPSGSPSQTTPLAAAGAARGLDAVFAAGGDGTVGAVAEALADTSTALGVLPIGTANIWAYELGLRTRLDSQVSVEACIEAQLAGDRRAVDIGEGHGRKFLLWAGLGLDAHVIGRIEPRPEIGKRLGQIYFLASGLLGGLDFRGGPMVIRTEQGEMRGAKMLVIVANVQHYAGTDSILDADARVDDGLFEVWSLAGESYWEVLSHLIRLKQGRHREHPAVNKIRGREIVIELGRPMPLHFDGELFGAVTRLELRLRPEALQVLAPRSTQSTIFERRK